MLAEQKLLLPPCPWDITGMPIHILLPLLFAVIAISYALRRLFNSRFPSDYLFIVAVNIMALVAVNITAIRYDILNTFLFFPPTLYSFTLLLFLTSVMFLDITVLTDPSLTHFNRDRLILLAAATKEALALLPAPILMFALVFIVVFYKSTHTLNELTISIVILDAVFIFGLFLFILGRVNFTYKSSHVVLFIMFLVVMVSIISIYAQIYVDLKMGDPIKKDNITFADAMYFSIVTWTTVGYGDIFPSTDARMYAASEALTGYIVMVLFVGALISLIRTITSVSNRTEISYSTLRILVGDKEVTRVSINADGSYAIDSPTKSPTEEV